MVQYFYCTLSLIGTITNKDHMGRYGPLKAKQHKETALKMRLNGSSQHEIAKAIGVGQSAVSKMLSDSDIKVLLNQCQRRMASEATKVTDKFMSHCYSESDKISLDAIKHYHQITGIAPSHAQSPFIQQIFINQDSGLQDAQFRSLAMQFLGLTPPDATSDPSIPIDITPVKATTSE